MADPSAKAFSPMKDTPLSMSPPPNYGYIHTPDTTRSRSYSNISDKSDGHGGRGRRKSSTQKLPPPTPHPKLILPVPEGEHALETAWSFWYDKKVPKSQSPAVNYHDNLKMLGSFNTIEGFWRYYTHMVRPNDLPKDYNYYMFRDEILPAWESFPYGGCWILKFRKRSGTLNKIWEKLLFAAIGELFEEPDVCGVVISTRSKEDLVSIWNGDNRNSAVHFRIGEKLEQIFRLDCNTLIEYKNHSTSMKDRSTFRNAKPYIIAASPPSNLPDSLTSASPMSDCPLHTSASGGGLGSTPQ
eukprot:gnl/Hemi2/28490_TR9425_c1_g1_i1.p1 gnl/Hemi2/28490_TR9425_c1_g1~~gnl/Hemi2/28490_TR9425_c1_g1_i1.p1  ORF type:complete len:324 (+),score=72.78 gnl/Hemi2/28490_TR9425_c1_g1_i1:81-974(+)